MKPMSFVLFFILVISGITAAQHKSGANQNQRFSITNWKRYFTLEPDEGHTFELNIIPVLSHVSVPGFHITPDEEIILSYSAGPAGLGQAVTNDNGQTFRPLSGLSAPMAGDGAFIYLPDGRTRFITEQLLPTATHEKHKSHLISWISEDGLNWRLEDGVRYQPGAEDDSIASVPAAIQVADSVWRLYYVGDWYRTNGIRTAISSDWGWTWQAESKQNILRKHDVDPHPVYLSDGRIRIYHRHMREPGGIAFTDGDGLVFDTTQTQMIIPDGLKGTGLQLDPAVIKFPDGRIGCFICSVPFFGQFDPPKIIAAWATDVAVSVGESRSAPEEFALDQNYPNPFNPATNISYRLSMTGDVELAIYDITGKRVRTLVNDRQNAGAHTVVWDGRDESGQQVVSGIYLYQLKAGREKETRRMVLMR